MQPSFSLLVSVATFVLLTRLLILAWRDGRRYKDGRSERELTVTVFLMALCLSQLAGTLAIVVIEPPHGILPALLLGFDRGLLFVAALFLTWSR